MTRFDLPELNLRLFDGGGAGAGAGAGAPGGDAGTSGAAEAQGETTAGPGITRRDKTGEQKVLYGKQAQGEAIPEAAPEAQETADAGQAQESGEGTPQKTKAEREKAFRSLIDGEYKDLYTEETQRMINRRFRDVKQMQKKQEQVQPLLDMLGQRYGVTDGDPRKLISAVENDNAYWEEAADEAGMSVEEFKTIQKLQRENARLRAERLDQDSRRAAQQRLAQWNQEAEETQRVYPDFDLNREAANPQFLTLLRSGIPVRHAYEVLHMEDIKAGAAQEAAKNTEKSVVDNIRAKGARPAENGMSSTPGFLVKDDVSKLTKRDRAEIARRAARGERISF